MSLSLIAAVYVDSEDEEDTGNWVRSGRLSWNKDGTESESEDDPIGNYYDIVDTHTTVYSQDLVGEETAAATTLASDGFLASIEDPSQNDFIKDGSDETVAATTLAKDDFLTSIEDPTQNDFIKGASDATCRIDSSTHIEEVETPQDIVTENENCLEMNDKSELFEETSVWNSWRTPSSDTSFSNNNRTQLLDGDANKITIGNYQFVSRLNFIDIVDNGNGNEYGPRAPSPISEATMSSVSAESFKIRKHGKRKKRKSCNCNCRKHRRRCAKKHGKRKLKVACQAEAEAPVDFSFPDINGDLVEKMVHPDENSQTEFSVPVPVFSSTPVSDQPDISGQDTQTVEDIANRSTLIISNNNRANTVKKSKRKTEVWSYKSQRRRYGRKKCNQKGISELAATPNNAQQQQEASSSSDLIPVPATTEELDDGVTGTLTTSDSQGPCVKLISTDSSQTETKTKKERTTKYVTSREKLQPQSNQKRQKRSPAGSSDIQDISGVEILSSECTGALIHSPNQNGENLTESAVDSVEEPQSKVNMRYKCPFCHQIFLDADQLLIHFSTSHTSSFPQFSNFNERGNIVLSEPLQSQRENVSFREMDQVSEEQNGGTGKPSSASSKKYPCCICRKTFANLSNSYRHLKKVHNIKGHSQPPGPSSADVMINNQALSDHHQNLNIIRPCWVILNRCDYDEESSPAALTSTRKPNRTEVAPVKVDKRKCDETSNTGGKRASLLNAQLRISLSKFSQG